MFCLFVVCLFVCLFQLGANSESKAVKEVLPYLSDSTIAALLKELGNDSSAVITAILEERLPSRLKTLLEKENQLQDEG